MRTTAEQRATMRAALADETYADLNRDEVRDVLALLDDLDEALSELAALRARLQAAEATIRDRLKALQPALDDLRAMTLTSQREVALLAEVAALRAVAEAARSLLGRMADGTRPSTERLRTALHAWEGRER